jgi:hypothetical protein
MTPRKRRSRISGKTQPKRRQPGKSKETISPADSLPPRDQPEGELPPNENIRKHPDEVYGDTEIPFRAENTV